MNGIACVREEWNMIVWWRECMCFVNPPPLAYHKAIPKAIKWRVLQQLGCIWEGKIAVTVHVTGWWRVNGSVIGSEFESISFGGVPAIGVAFAEAGKWESWLKAERVRRRGDKRFREEDRRKGKVCVCGWSLCVSIKNLWVWKKWVWDSETCVALRVRASIMVFFDLWRLHGRRREGVVWNILGKIYCVGKEVTKAADCLVTTVLNGRAHVSLQCERLVRWNSSWFNLLSIPSLFQFSLAIYLVFRDSSEKFALFAVAVGGTVWACGGVSGNIPGNIHVSWCPERTLKLIKCKCQQFSNIIQHNSNFTIYPF